MVKSSLKHDLSFIKVLMAAENSEIDFTQINFNAFDSQDGKIIQDDRDPDLNSDSHLPKIIFLFASMIVL